MNKNDRYPDLLFGMKARIAPQLRGAVISDGWMEFAIDTPVLCFCLPRGVILDDNFHVRFIMYRISMQCEHPNGIPDVVLEFPEGMSICVPADAIATADFIIREFAYNQSLIFWGGVAVSLAPSWN